MIRPHAVCSAGIACRVGRRGWKRVDQRFAEPPRLCRSRTRSCSSTPCRPIDGRTAVPPAPLASLLSCVAFSTGPSQPKQPPTAIVVVVRWHFRQPGRGKLNGFVVGGCDNPQVLAKDRKDIAAEIDFSRESARDSRDIMRAKPIVTRLIGVQNLWSDGVGVGCESSAVRKRHASGDREE